MVYDREWMLCRTDNQGGQGALRVRLQIYARKYVSHADLFEPWQTFDNWLREAANRQVGTNIARDLTMTLLSAYAMQRSDSAANRLIHQDLHQLGNIVSRSPIFNSQERARHLRQWTLEEIEWRYTEHPRNLKQATRTYAVFAVLIFLNLLKCYTKLVG